jgi:hypothetical protein
MGGRVKCGNCLFWDHRAEAEVDEHTGYCTVHEMMKRDEQQCDLFERRTPESENRYYQKLYNDGTDYGDDDGEMVDL